MIKHLGAEPYIRVGLLTDGAPSIEAHGASHRVNNLLIGDGFHWQKNMHACFGGDIEVLDEAEGHITCVNSLPMEEYVACVVSSEMNASAPMEFLKAHAVISRSWALRRVLAKDSGHAVCDVCSDDHCQRYQGLPDNTLTARCLQAVRDTAGIVLTDENGEVADTRFSKCCGGITELFSTCWEGKDMHYLASTADPWCDLSDMDREEREELLATSLKDYDYPTGFHTWEAEADPAEIRALIKDQHGCDIGDIKDIVPLHRGASGRINSMAFEGTRLRLVIGKTLAIRRVMARNCLKSSWFDVEKLSNGKFLLKGHGWGHGVGLCQIGAARMAHDGKNFREILAHYYHGAETKAIYECNDNRD